MVITRHGPAFFKVQYGDTVLAFNPPAESSDLDSSRFGADITLTSIRHPDFSGGELLTGGDKDPFEVSGPGEYEIGGIFVQGLPSESEYDDQDWINTIYLAQLQGMQICNLGLLSQEELPAESAEAIETIDILFVPIEGNGTIEPSEAYKLAVNLEPSVVIPSYYEDEESLETFLEEAGVADEVEPQEKITLNSRDVSGSDEEIRVLEIT